MTAPPPPALVDLARLAEVEADLAAVRDRLATLEARKADSAQVVELGTQLLKTTTDYEASAHAPEKTCAALRTRLDRRLGDFESSLDDLRLALRGPAAAGQQADGTLAALAERVERLEGEDGALAKAIVQLRRQHRTLTKDVTTLATSLGELAELATPGRWRR